MSSLPFAKKALGQHWLEDQASLEAMAMAGHIMSTDTVLEIGPGTGTLTEELILSGAHITALEFDAQRCKELSHKYSQNSYIDVIQGDIRTFDLGLLPEDYKIVANIPYYLTANLLRKLADSTNKPSKAVLLVQKEVAQKVASHEGNLSLVAIFTQIYYEVSLGQIVPAHLFVPPPKVDSQILILIRRNQPLFEVDESFTKLVKAGFEQKRKKLRTSLAGGLGINKDAVEQYLQKAGIRVDARAQELSIESWHKLSKIINNT